MSLRPEPIPAVPEETARVARAAFPRGNRYLILRDELGPFFADEPFAALYPSRGQPALAPWRLALVTIWQFLERLSDRQAANAVRARIGWKYALSLELHDPGFDRTVLSEFRSRLVGGAAEERLLDLLLDQCRQRGWLKARGRQRTDATHVRGCVRAINRLECAVETLRQALNCLAIVAPQWLQAHSQAEWLLRYGRRCEESRLPAGQEERRAYAQQVGADGYALWAALQDPAAPSWLRRVPAPETLRQVWLQPFYHRGAQVRWRTEAEGIPPSGLRISSPYDPEARYAKKSTTTAWAGYKVHLTEACEDEGPHRITHVLTAAAPIAEGEVLPALHPALDDKDLLPGKHVADSSYVDAALLVRSRQEHGADLVGPARADSHWQAEASAGFAASDFAIDWERQQATCPEGRTSTSWKAALDPGGNDIVQIEFSAKACQACPSRAQCTRGKRRSLTLRPHEQYLALQAARSREGSEEFQAEYARRAGIEGTISEGVRAHGLRRAR
jgi:transposase